MKTDPKNYVLNNGLVKIPVASKLCILTYDQGMAVIANLHSFLHSQKVQSTLSS